jgi:hypothetical protein
MQRESSCRWRLNKKLRCAHFNDSIVACRLRIAVQCTKIVHSTDWLMLEYLLQNAATWNTVLYRTPRTIRTVVCSVQYRTVLQYTVCVTPPDQPRRSCAIDVANAVGSDWHERLLYTAFLRSCSLRYLEASTVRCCTVSLHLVQ